MVAIIAAFIVLTLHGIPKPAYRAFELLHHPDAARLLVDDPMTPWTHGHSSPLAGVRR